MNLPAYEKLGSLYLGCALDSNGKETGELVLYDSRDLTTHAVCVGMTGSGKTGLCIGLLEEAALDGVPVLAIDPKGDLGNLALQFPNLAPADFLPWIDPAEAARKDQTPEAYAAQVAARWKSGLAEWQEDGERIKRLQAAAEVVIYTPGSSAARGLSVLRSFAAPAAAILADTTALRERVANAAAALLGLLGMEADPLKSREHILLSTLFDQAWRAGEDLDLAALIQRIQKPPFDKVGVFDLETFFPMKERLSLAMAVNNLIAAPGFSAWLTGEPLDMQGLLFTETGKPRIAVVSIAHLSDAERMFAVTLLLNEMLAWMRRQSGTSSLRALLYMDEIFGYCPPTAMPPSKLPLLTLMKQARAFGVGVVLATQNPVDLDYKSLSNAGTWFIGRLQTERDKARVLEGLTAAGAGLDSHNVGSLLANLDNRVFLMRNVHEDAPVLMRTRWTMSYLRGPMTLQELQRISGRGEPRDSAPRPSLMRAARPMLPADIKEYFLAAEGQTRYEPRVLGVAKLHFVDAAADVDVWQGRAYVAPVSADGAGPEWSSAAVIADAKQRLSTQALPALGFADLPAALMRTANYTGWSKDLAGTLYRNAVLELHRCPKLDLAAAPGESERDFRARLALSAREKRDAAIQSLRNKYAARLATLASQQQRARQDIERQQGQLSQQKLQAAINVGSTLLGAFLGRKFGAGTLGRAGGAARSAGRIATENADVARAQENFDAVTAKLAALKAEVEQEIAALHTEWEADTLAIETAVVKPRKSDIEVEALAIVWVPI